MHRRIKVLLAITSPDEASLVEAALAAADCLCGHADDLRAVEQSMGDSDVIVTDTEFAAGAFADWLSLWPIPAVLVTDLSADPAKLAADLVDESSSFIRRDPAGLWVGFIPMLVRKAAAIRESLDRQNSNIIRAESSYMNLLRAVPDIVYVLDGDGCFAYLNDAVSQLGWKPSELIGKHFAELVHPDDLPNVCRSLVLGRYEGVATGPDDAPKLFDERRGGERMTRNLEVRLRHRGSGEWADTSVDSWGEVTSLGVRLPEFQGRGTGTIGLIHDVSERREHERRMSKELDARNLLLKEIHHRVKNNLQVVSSLLSLESDCVEDERAKAVFVECQTQVQSMSLVHEQIYRGSTLDGVEASAYFERLAEYLAGVHDAGNRGIRLLVEPTDVVLSIDTAMPLSIIATELVSNSFKHGFADGAGGRVSIAMARDGDEYALTVSDDGAGFRAGQHGRDASAPAGKSKGIGMDLVEALAAQLGGSLERGRPAAAGEAAPGRSGAVTTVRFPVRDAAQDR
ncbi:MAG TPA: histidine kinase dimerization/phosphoacceptor domain -containing protein [Spirochaetia bacterium]|nr:histidine kinase dimerization/phosphoacceptor domain -containing protein [Spirochaetales bacterium]HRW24195.1 histidine kinase dimerization/phosphoacceptor domain -containing protein [Spirochaetia bacterium]